MPAHVTLIYPFADDNHLVSDEITEARTVIGRFAPFNFALTDVRRFDNLPKESYVWLAPSPAEPFIEIIEALASAFPGYPPFGGVFSSIVPHLTVAYSTDDHVLRTVEDRLAGTLPINARATTATIMEDVAGTWRLRASIQLAGM